MYVAVLRSKTHARFSQIVGLAPTQTVLGGPAMQNSGFTLLHPAIHVGPEECEKGVVIFWVSEYVCVWSLGAYGVK